MIWAAVLAGAIGAGICLLARAVFPPARPLRTLSEELLEPRATVRLRVGGTADVKRWWERLAARIDAGQSDRLIADLNVLGRSATRHTVDKLGYTLVYTGLADVGAIVAVPILRVPVPVVSVAGAIILFGLVGWVYPDLEVRSRARATRKAWSQVITVFVDVVGISLAGGAGVEDALMVAAQAGNGPQFEELAAAMRAAQTRRRKLWYALDDLGIRCDIGSLRELAAAVELAAESGSRIRETLVAKAEAMRVRQLTDAEAEAQKSSETMGIAPALMAIAAIILIGYPAVARFLE